MSTYVLKGGTQEGPYGDEHVEKLLKQGTIRPDDFGWRPGMHSWQKLGSLYPSLGNPAEPPPIPRSTTSAPAVSATRVSPQKILRFIAIAVVALAFVLATIGQLFLSCCLGILGGVMLWHGYFPRASAKWKVGVAAATGFLCLIWGAAAKRQGIGHTETTDSSARSVPQPPPSKPAGPPESVLLRPGPYHVSASFKRGEPLVSEGIAGVPIGAVIYPVRYSSDTNGTYYFFQDSFEDWHVFYKLEMAEEIFGPFPCRM